MDNFWLIHRRSWFKSLRGKYMSVGSGAFSKGWQNLYVRGSGVTLDKLFDPDGPQFTQLYGCSVRLVLLRLKWQKDCNGLHLPYAVPICGDHRILLTFGKTQTKVKRGHYASVLILVTSVKEVKNGNFWFSLSALYCCDQIYFLLPKAICQWQSTSLGRETTKNVLLPINDGRFADV